MSKALKRFGNIVSTLLVILMLALCTTVVVPRVLGMRPFAVLSGSMEPTYHVGSLIYVKATPPEEIQIGDPITFVLNEDLMVATHRVVRIEGEYFYTKGDANNAEDISPVYFKNLVGKPVFSIPYMGYVSAFINTKRGMIITATVFIALAILVFLPDIFAKFEQKEQTRQNRKLEG